MGQLLPLTAKEALPVEQPAIEQEKQAQDSPTSLVGTDLVKMIAVEEERAERGEQEGERRKSGHKKRRQPKPPLAPGDLVQISFRLLCAEGGQSLERRGTALGFAKT